MGGDGVQHNPIFKYNTLSNEKEIRLQIANGFPLLGQLQPTGSDCQELVLRDSENKWGQQERAL